MIRQPTAAGLFYPADRQALQERVDGMLDAAGRRPDGRVRGIVAPHAGYAYSGPVAASAFALVPRVREAAVLGPSHFVPLTGLAVSGADAWRTPLGDVPISTALRQRALGAGATVQEVPHAGDHALEVELPFLQRTCGAELEILPVAVGRTDAAEVAHLIDALDAFVVVSTDLSHYLDDGTARVVDEATARAVVRSEPEAIPDEAACGVFALRGLVEHARRGLHEVELLDLQTSADATGDRSQVVGYGAFAVRSGTPTESSSTIALTPASRSLGCRRPGSR